MMTIAVLLWLQLRRFAIGARPALIEEFMENISIFTSEEMIFIDEVSKYIKEQTLKHDR